MTMNIERKGIMNRVFNALVIVTLFSITGFLLPPLISRMISTSYYYDVDSPAIVDKIEYVPGETVLVSLQRFSRVSQAAEETLELSLVQTESDEDIQSERRYINIEEGSRTVRIRYKLPEDLKSGSYVIRGNIHFRVEGLARDAQFFTEEFLVSTTSAQLQ